MEKFIVRFRIRVELIKVWNSHVTETTMIGRNLSLKAQLEGKNINIKNKTQKHEVKCVLSSFSSGNREY